MKINWILADNIVLDPLADVSKMKDIGSLWGSWKTWRGCSTDNVICNDTQKAQELIQRKFQTNCNFYISNSTYLTLDRPENVKLFEGAFTHDVDHHDELVAMHLASSMSDIILLLGFNWQEQSTQADKLLEHRAHNYRQLVHQVIVDNPQVQWVLIDHSGNIMPELSKLENLTKDTMETALGLLG